ncbi:MAG TPA: oxidoreductase [Microthrixaceae bacterium]|nr:SDR family NAD(P)-dependent oxidoreductase [Microthrixaceae bacterium]HNI34111.1 oxidoreductase [Microthrixaceae bacterium]
MWSEADIGDLDGRVAVVTGANSGIGLETTRALAKHGATVVMAVRSPERGESAAADIAATVPGARLELQRLDLASLESVADAASAIRDRYEHIDLLVNNAGVMYTDRELTPDGFELQFGTNHLGHFAFTLRLLDRLIATGDSRVVTVGSLGHWFPFAFDLDDLSARKRYNRFAAYSRSKLANLMFAFELQERLAALGEGTFSVAAHPGGSDTELANHVPGMGFMRKRMSFLAQSAAMGALPTLRAATDPSVVGGQYVGPDRFLQTRGNPIIVGSSRRSRDRSLRQRLWQVSEEATGVRFDGVVAGV